MAGSLLLVLLLLTLTNGLPDCPNTTGVMFINQPQDSTICVGGQLKMDCAYTGIGTAPLWRINSTTYSSFMLPEYYTYNGRALILNSAFLEENDTTYQCFFELYNIITGAVCQLKSREGRLTVMTNDQCEQHPENITCTVGDTDVYIPCTVLGYNPQIWEINGLIYEIFQLPKMFTPTYGGIIIKIIQGDLNGFSFRCYTHIGTGYTVEASSTGYLSVISRGDTMRINVDSSDLYIDHQNTIFDKNITLSWKPIDDSRCNDYELTSRTECGLTSPVMNMWSTHHLNMNFSYNSLSINGSGDNQERADILIKANDQNTMIVCTQTKATIQVQNPVTSKKLISSFSRTEVLKFSTISNSTFYLVLPRFGTGEDCFCPIFFTRNVKCYSTENCSCIGDTVFRHSFIEFCRLEDDDVSLQIQNLTHEMNGNRLMIFHEYFCKRTSRYIPPYRVYTTSFEIEIGMLEPPNVTIDEESNKIKIFILPYDENENPPDSYSIFVYDITGEQLLHDYIMATNTTICIPIKHQHLNVCAPLLATVSAINIFGQANTIIYTHSENKTGDACSCLNKTVTLRVHFNNTEETTILEILCNQSTYNGNVTLIAEISPKMKQDIVCTNNVITSEKTNIVIDTPSCEEIYNISIYWNTPNMSLDAHCLLWHFELNPKCIGSNGDLIIFISVGVFVLLFVVGVIIITTIYLRCKNHSQRTNINEDSKYINNHGTFPDGTDDTDSQTKTSCL